MTHVKVAFSASQCINADETDKEMMHVKVAFCLSFISSEDAWK